MGTVSVGRFLAWSRCCVLAALVMAAGFTPAFPVARAGEPDAKTRIIEELSGKNWQQHVHPYRGYNVGRFYIEGSFQTSKSHRDTAARLLDSATRGEFEIIAPAQAGQKLKDLPRYLAEKPACAATPVRYWDGLSEMSPSQYERLKAKGSSDFTPYVPGAPRPIDYEVQIGGNSKPVAVARSSFEYYELKDSATGSSLRLFRGEDYAPINSGESSSLRLEGSFAAFEVPSCRFIGTLDYFTKCIAPRGNPFRQDDKKRSAHVIRLDDKPFVITISHSLCDAETSPSQHILYLWDVTAPGPIPAVYGFSFFERK